MSNPILQQIEAALNGIRPYMEADGGNVEVLDYTVDKVLKLKFTGHCSSCPMSSMTFKAGVQEAVMKSVPDIKEIVVVNLATS